MTRTYELVFIADPRLPDEEVVALTEEYKSMLTADGTTTITREESWGRRKLAYPIQKLHEGKYVLLYLEAEPKNSIPEVEQRMLQNDKVLRHLVVRTDVDLKRAASKGKPAPKVGNSVEGAAPSGPVAAAESA